MVRTVDFDSRRKEILSAAIDYYIRTATPVSSGVLVQEYGFTLSPATIRNVFAELEEQGYLTHPHTSAGRIPTQKGYRYYVDYLMKEIKLLGAEKERVESDYRKSIRQLESLLDKTSQVLSDLTHYTGIVALQANERLFYKGASFMAEQPEFKNIEKIRNVLQLLEQKERLLQIINRDLKKKIDYYYNSFTTPQDDNDEKKRERIQNAYTLAAGGKPVNPLSGDAIASGGGVAPGTEPKNEGKISEDAKKVAENMGIDEKDLRRHKLI